MEKNKEEPLVNRSQSITTRGTKRSAKEMTGETITDKRWRPVEEETDERMEKLDEEIQKDDKKDLIETQEDSSDNSNTETSFMDLPDDIHLKIFSFLDLQSRLKLRVSKRLDRLHFAVKANLAGIRLELKEAGRRHSKLFIFNRSKFRISIFTQWEEVLRRFSLNTSVDDISVMAYRTPSQGQCGVMDALFHFKANSLGIYSRYAVLEGSCMKFIRMRFENMDKNFMKECFGVITEDILGPLRGTFYHSANDSLEIYRRYGLEHFEDDLRTVVNEYYIFFIKDETTEKPHDNSSNRMKRSAEEENNKKAGETNIEKILRPTDNMEETGNRLEKADEEIQEDTEKELIETQNESSDYSDSETSFMDLPDDIHLKIFSFLDLQSRLKLRVNKRLDRLHFSVKAHLGEIRLELNEAGRRRSKLTIFNRTKFRISIFTEWEEVLRRFSQNTSVDDISIKARTSLNQDQCRVLDALFHFKANLLEIYSRYGNPVIPHLTLPSFLTLTQNVVKVDIDVSCTSLTAQDLCIIRKAILDGSCMKSLQMSFDRSMNKNFMNECFGVITEDILGPLSGTFYHSAIDSPEIYRQLYWSVYLQHFEGEMRTVLNDYCICFIKGEGIQKPHDRFKLRLNHVSSNRMKRPAEEGENEKSEETNTEKRLRPTDDEKETGDRLEKTEEKIHKDAEKALIEAQDESSVISDSETSFMDLPDDIHLKIFAFLDLPSRLKLRVNKRLDRLHFSVKAHLTRIRLDLDEAGSRRSKLTIFNRTKFRISIFTQWEEVLRRFSLNTSVDDISIVAHRTPSQDQCRVMDALFHFKANSLGIYSLNGNPVIPHLALPSFLTLTQNVKKIDIDICCTSLTAQDLCVIRKAMLDGSCMTSFQMLFDRSMNKNFLKECFGVITEDILGPLSGTFYHSANDSLEMYRWLLGLRHYEGDFLTVSNDYCIIFLKDEAMRKPPDEFKLKLNHVYGVNEEWI